LHGEVAVASGPLDLSVAAGTWNLGQRMPQWQIPSEGSHQQLPSLVPCCKWWLWISKPLCYADCLYWFWKLYFCLWDKFCRGMWKKIL